MKGKINTEKEKIYRLIAFFFRICYYAAITRAFFLQYSGLHILNDIS